MLHLIFVPAKSRTLPLHVMMQMPAFFADDYFFSPLDSIIFFGLFSKLVANATASLGRSGR
jgi:hypothetical protein